MTFLTNFGTLLAMVTLAQAGVVDMRDETSTITAAPAVMPRLLSKDLHSARQYLSSCQRSCTDSAQADIMKTRSQMDDKDTYCNNYGDKKGEACFCGQVVENDLQAFKRIAPCVETTCTDMPDEAKAYLGIAPKDWKELDDENPALDDEPDDPTLDVGHGLVVPGGDDMKGPAIVWQFIDTLRMECRNKVNQLALTEFPGKTSESEAESESTDSTESTTSESSSTTSAGASVTISTSLSRSSSSSETISVSVWASRTSSSTSEPSATESETTPDGAVAMGTPDAKLFLTLMLGGIIMAGIYAL